MSEAQQEATRAGPPAATPAPPAADRRSQRAVLAAVVLAVLALVAVAGLAWWGERTMREAARTAGRAAAQAADSGEALTRIEGALARQQAELEALTGRLAKAEQATQQALQRRAADSARVVRLWRLAEVEYLVQAADERLTLAADPRAAARALALAADRLAGASGSAETALRAAVLDARERVAAVPMPDLQALVLEVAAVRDAAGRLQAPGLEAPEAQAKADAKPPAPAGDWRAALHAFWRDLRSLVEVERLDDSQALMLGARGRRLLALSLRGELEAARLAALQRAPGAWRASLEAADALLERYFPADDPQVARVRARLRELAGRPLVPGPAPDLGPLLAQVRAVRESAAGEPGS